MPKFMFIYHGGGRPELFLRPQAGTQVVQQALLPFLVI